MSRISPRTKSFLRTSTTTQDYLADFYDMSHLSCDPCRHDTRGRHQRSMYASGQCLRYFCILYLVSFYFGGMKIQATKKDPLVS